MLNLNFETNKATDSDWSSERTTENHYWTATKSELRDLKTNEQYQELNQVGGINIKGGSTNLRIISSPSQDFNFFNKSRLNMDITVEGDMEIYIPSFNTDYHLLLVPLRYNNESFLEQLIEEKTLLENLTQSVYQDSLITDTLVTVDMLYHDILEIHYEWDPTTGLLIRKEATAPSGRQLIVVARGYEENNVSTGGWLVAITTVMVIIHFTKRKKPKEK